jgi:Effector Associated Constant Component 1
MAETYTIESADGSVPIDPRLLRELRDLLREDEDLDLGVRLKDRQPAPGEQGAIPLAVEIITVATPLGRIYADVLKHWIHRHKDVSIKVRRKSDGLSIELSGMSVHDAERLITNVESGSGAELDDGG